MLAHQKILFSGMSWPAARVVDRSPIVREFVSELPEPPKSWVFTLAATGKGRAWSTMHPQAFWRDFAEELLYYDNEARVLAFVRRRGDPYGEINRKGGTADTAKWMALTSYLFQLAQAWDPEDDDGVSRRSNDAARLNPALAFWRQFVLPDYVRADLEPDPDGGAEVVLRAKTLGSFMALSAGSALARAIPMRRCQHCTSWLEAPRKDIRFCSGSCRALFHDAQQ